MNASFAAIRVALLAALLALVQPGFAAAQDLEWWTGAYTSSQTGLEKEGFSREDLSFDEVVALNELWVDNVASYADGIIASIGSATKADEAAMNEAYITLSGVEATLVTLIRGNPGSRLARKAQTALFKVQVAKDMIRDRWIKLGLDPRALGKNLKVRAAPAAPPIMPQDMDRR